MTLTGNLSTEANHCIDVCKECAATCVETISHCLQQGGSQAHPEHILLLEMCSEICELTARSLLFGFAKHEVICSACAEVCEDCAEACLKFAGDDFMQACASACQLCVTSCTEMVTGAKDEEFRSPESNP